MELGDVAAQEIQQIQGVQALVDHGAAAGIFPLAAPGLSLVVGVVTAPGHEAADADNLAVLTGVDDLLQLFGGLVHTVLEAHTDLDLGVGGFQGAELLSLLGVQGDGLFAEYVEAHFHQLLGDGVVQIVGQQVVDHVGLNLGDHLLVIGIELDAGGNLGGQLFVNIADSNQLHAGVGSDGVDMHDGDGAKADDCSLHHSGVLL